MTKLIPALMAALFAVAIVAPAFVADEIKESTDTKVEKKKNSKMDTKAEGKK